ncbi:unnamed protein product [Diplocarpon coronariae]
MITEKPQHRHPSHDIPPIAPPPGSRVVVERTGRKRVNLVWAPAVAGPHSHGLAAAVTLRPAMCRRQQRATWVLGALSSKTHAGLLIAAPEVAAKHDAGSGRLEVDMHRILGLHTSTSIPTHLTAVCVVEASRFHAGRGRARAAIAHPRPAVYHPPLGINIRQVRDAPLALRGPLPWRPFPFSETAGPRRASGASPKTECPTNLLPAVGSIQLNSPCRMFLSGANAVRFILLQAGKHPKALLLHEAASTWTLRLSSHDVSLGHREARGGETRLLRVCRGTLGRSTVVGDRSTPIFPPTRDHRLTRAEAPRDPGRREARYTEEDVLIRGGSAKSGAREKKDSVPTFCWSTKSTSPPARARPWPRSGEIGPTPANVCPAS